MTSLLTPTAGRWIAGLALAGAITLLARRRGSLTGWAALGGMLTGGVLVGAGGWWTGLLLVLFFITADGLTRLPRVGGQAARPDRRTVIQVLANGGAALVFTALSGLTGQAAWLAGALGAIAAANADTWATEVGRRFGGRPRSIVTFQPLASGTSGGITAVGTLAAVAGAALIGAAAALGVRLNLIDAGATAPAAGALIATAGFVGALLDSVLGATVQVMYRCPICGALTEQPVHHVDVPAMPVRGLVWATNDAVNAASTLVAAALAAGTVALATHR